jgi:hypothetical protein
MHNDSSSVSDVSPGRRTKVYALLAVLVAGHAHEIARQQEHWPFSNYPMWARLSSDWYVKDVAAVGVTAQDPPREVRLTDPRYTEPLSLYYLRFGVLRRAANRPQIRESILRDYLEYYERRRISGGHDGPALRGVRLYEHFWTMNASAANARTPDRSTLICEISATGHAGVDSLEHRLLTR